MQFCVLLLLYSILKANYVTYKPNPNCICSLKVPNPDPKATPVLVLQRISAEEEEEEETLPLTPTMSLDRYFKLPDGELFR